MMSGISYSSTVLSASVPCAAIGRAVLDNLLTVH